MEKSVIINYILWDLHSPDRTNLQGIGTIK